MIALRGVHKSHGPAEILRGIDVAFARNEKVAIIGPSGSGKSTLLRLLMALERPDAGTIEIAGEAMWTMFRDGREVPADDAHLRRIRRRLGMVFQQFNLFPHLNVLDNLTIAPRLVLGRSHELAEENARQWLCTVGLADKVAAYPAQLSGGQKQRVAIARALAMEPDVMLFDEITSGLDPQLVAEVLLVLRQLARDTDVTMIIVTHQMDFASEIADRVLLLDDGVVVEDGPPEALLTRPRQPRTREFLRTVLGSGGAAPATKSPHPSESS
jgi:polar amino acid transport system ATP-binding protein